MRVPRDRRAAPEEIHNNVSVGTNETNLMSPKKKVKVGAHGEDEGNDSWKISQKKKKTL